MAADAEMCMMAADTMEALGIRRGNYVIKVNNRKVLDGVMEAIGLGGEDNAGKAADGVARDRQVGPIGRRRGAQLLGPVAKMRAAISPRAPVSRMNHSGHQLYRAGVNAAPEPKSIASANEVTLANFECS